MTAAPPRQPPDRTAFVPGLPPAPREGWGPRPDGSWSYRGSGLPGRPVERNHGAVDRVPPPRTPETPRQQLMGRVWDVTWEAARRAPHPVAFGLADLGGRLAPRMAGRLAPSADGEPMIRRNLARVVPADELDDAVRRAYTSYARYYVEAFRAADMDPAWLDERTTTGGFEHLDGVLDEGRGAIILLAHHGSWDVAARWAESHGYHLGVVAEVLRPRRVFTKFVAMREALGLEIVPLRRGDDVAPPAGRGQSGAAGAAGQASTTGRLRQVLAANHLVGLLSDRDLTGRAPVVELFGEPARLPAGPALLSARSGAQIVPITMLHRPGGRYHLQCLEAFSTADLSPREGVQRTARALEELIRLDPAQWHAFQPVFLADQEAAGGGRER